MLGEALYETDEGFLRDSRNHAVILEWIMQIVSECFGSSGKRKSAKD